jgi:hypothetical protein
LKLPIQSIRKLLRDCFPGQSPIEVDLRHRPQLVKDWRSRLEKIEGIRVTNHPGDNDSRSRTLCRFTIPDPHQNAQYWRSDELRLEYSEELQLRIIADRWRGETVAVRVSSAEEIADLARQTLQRYARRHAGAKKREKVRRFKSNAIIAQVEKIAAAEKFDYATSVDSQKLRLYVRLSKQEIIEIQIPFSRFEKVLPQVKNTIAMMRDLYQDGLKFKMATTHRLPFQTEWVRHRDEGNERGDQLNDESN